MDKTHGITTQELIAVIGYSQLSVILLLSACFSAGLGHYALAIIFVVLMAGACTRGERIYNEIRTKLGLR